jgi:hypothetical protein
VPGRSLSRLVGVVDSELPEVRSTQAPTVAPGPADARERRLRLADAAADQDFAAPPQPEIGAESRKVREIPASADVAQLVEHFTRNEGVRGSSPRVGSGRKTTWKFGCSCSCSSERLDHAERPLRVHQLDLSLCSADRRAAAASSLVANIPR